jgi:beta-mannosidase
MLKQQTLHAGWKLRQAGRVDWYPAQVPGAVHMDLLRAGVIGDPFFGEYERTLQWIGYADWEYQLYFALPTDCIKRRRVELVFEGLDTYARAYLNDVLVLETDNMFREWRIDARAHLRLADNVLRILFRSPIQEDLPKLGRIDYALPAANDAGEKTSPFTRKAPYHFGWDWGPRFVTAGIWKPVRLEAWDDARIVSVFHEQRKLTERLSRITAHVELMAAAELAEKTIRLFARDFERFGALHEYYLPESGEPVLNRGFQNWNYLMLNMAAWYEGRPVVREF